MKSVINAAARRNMDQIKDQMGQEALGLAAQSLRLRSESEVAALHAGTAPRVSHDAPVPSGTGQPLANYLAAKRVGDLLYLSGVIAVNPA
ncbi:MAG: hypothetical protein HC858_08875, partial [Brachymonas sp.]|nr:hypothetical protein [Brachymonas sp.]